MQEMACNSFRILIHFGWFPLSIVSTSFLPRVSPTSFSAAENKRRPSSTSTLSSCRFAKSIRSGILIRIMGRGGDGRMFDTTLLIEWLHQSQSIRNRFLLWDDDKFDDTAAHTTLSKILRNHSCSGSGHTNESNPNGVISFGWSHVFM